MRFPPARNERNSQNRAMMRAKIRNYRAEIGGKSDEEKAAALTSMYSLIDTQARKVCCRRSAPPG